MKKPRSFMLLISALFFIAQPVYSQRKSFFEASFGFRARPKLELSGFPAEYRAIPRHPDDNWLMYSPLANNTLPDDTLTMLSSPALDFTLALSRSPILIGIVISMHDTNIGDSTRHVRHSQNQFGTTDRSYGTSLRWYEPRAGQFQLGIIAGLKSPWIRISEKIASRVEAGYVRDLTGIRIVIKSGYDRYSSDEAYKTNRIATLKEHLFFGSLEVGGLLDPDEIEYHRVYVKIRFLRPIYEFVSKQQTEPILLHNKVRAFPMAIALGFTF